MRQILLLVLALLYIETASGQVNQPDKAILNNSGIKYSPITAVSNQNATIGASYCKGWLKKHPDALTKIGISPELLKDGCSCTVGDFDANGYLDFAFWGIDTSEPKQNGFNKLDYENYVILFFEESDMIETQLIKTDPGFPLVYYPKRLEIGPNGEPISNKDALWIWGETDGYDDLSKGQVFIYNTQDSKFQSIEF